MTVLEAIQRSTDYLTRKGVESPRRNAEELLAHLLRQPRLQIYLGFERRLTPTEVGALREMVKRRGQREPLQHIMGTVSFCGLELAVGRGALVPRPETELLAELAWQHLAGLDGAALSALDFGTGTGCLAIALAVKTAALRVEVLDVSDEALMLARQNAATHGVADRIEFRCGDGWAAVPADRQFDLIVSNPPYVPSTEIETLEPEVRDFDPRVALDGGADGLEFFRQAAQQAGFRLKPEGRIMLEFGAGQTEAVRALFVAQNWVVEQVVEDYSRRPRVLVARPL